MVRMLKDWTIALLVAAVVFVVVGWFQTRPDLPSEAPEFAIEDLDGETFDLAALQGQTVVLNFWASWCGPCKAEVPEFARFHDDHPEIPVIGLAVNSGDEVAVRRAAETFGINYPVAVADNSTIRAYDVSTLPTTVIVGPAGEVKSARVGSMTYEQLIQAVR